MATHRVGQFAITRIEEMLTPGFVPGFLFPDFTADIFAQAPQLKEARFWDEASAKVMSSMHSWVIRDGKRTILVDTGCGNAKRRALPMFQRFHMLDLPYLDQLAAAGIRREDVDLVICTHLHVDHVGWNTMLVDGRWVPTFPNARYIFGRGEFAHWRSPTGGITKLPENEEVITDSVMPIVEAGLADFVDAGDRLFDGLEIAAAPGHTAGQFQVRLTDGHDAAVFSGDCIHQPMQVYRPDWNSRFCEEPEVARATRRDLLDWCADRGALLLPAHFGAPHAGRVRRHADSFTFLPADDL